MDQLFINQIAKSFEDTKAIKIFRSAFVLEKIFGLLGPTAQEKPFHPHYFGYYQPEHRITILGGQMTEEEIESIGLSSGRRGFYQDVDCREFDLPGDIEEQPKNKSTKNCLPGWNALI